jgi:hypothetical protein
MNTNVSNRNAEETGEDGTPVKYIQSTNSTSDESVVDSIEMIIHHAEEDSTTNESTTNGVTANTEN